MDVTLCIEGSCQYVPIFEGFSLSPPNSCDGGMPLPGDGTINGLLEELDGDIGEAGVLILLNSIGLTVSE